MIAKHFNPESFLHYLNKCPAYFSYGLAGLAVSLAALATLYIPVIGQRAAFLLFFFAIIQAAFWLGRNPGIFAMFLSFIAVNGFVLNTTWMSAPQDALILNTGFCFLASIFISTTSLHRRLTSLLLENRQDMNLAQTVGKIGSWRLNVPRNELLWSDENYRLFGVPQDTQLSYESFLATIHPEDREYVDLKWQAALRGEPYDIEHRIIVDGIVKWVHEKAVLEFGQGGNLLGGFGITQDITDRKNSEITLELSQQRYAGIIDSAMDAIITIDADHRILVFNSAAEKMFACPAAEAIGKSLDRFIPESFRYNHSSQVRAFGRTGVTRRKMGLSGKLAGVRTSGEEFPIDASISQCEIMGIKSFTAILRDITERVQAESVLKEQLRLKDQLSKITTSVPGVICSFRLRPNGTSYMPYASPVFESVSGLSIKLVAKDFSPFFARIHSDDIEHVNETTAESARTLQPWQGTFRYNHPTKGEIWLESHSMPQREIDGSLLWHGYIQDVTERKRAEAELKERTARYELVLEGAQDAIWDWDVPNKCVHYSSRWKTLRGFTENEVGTDEETWSANIFPDDKVRVLAAVQSHFEGRTSVFCEEYRIRCKDGSWKWILDRGIALKDSSGQIVRMAGSESDVTGRKLAEMALRDRENELSLIMNAIPALLAYLDTDFRYLRVNKTYENWFCIPQKNILGHEAREIVGERAWHIVEPYLEQARAGEQVSFDYQIPYGNGNPRWVHGNYIPDKDSYGIVKGIVVHVVDINDRKQAEQKIAFLNKNLQQRIEEMQVIFDTAPIGLAIADDDQGYHIRGNPANERLLGLPPGSELSKKGDANTDYRIMQNGREMAVDDLPMQRAVRGESVSNLIIDILRPDGRMTTALSNAAPLFNEQGAPRGAIGVFLDITELKQAEAKIRESEVRLALVVEQVKAGYWDWDLISNKIYLSPEWKRQIGFEDNEIVNQRAEWESRLHPDDHDRVINETENFITGCQADFELQFRLRHKDGSYRWIHSRAALLRDHISQPIRMLGINLDITDYIKNQEMNERRDEMEKSFRLYVASQTAAAIAHELNQPLTAISYYAYVAQDMLSTGNQNSQKLAQVMEKCGQQAQRAGDVIKQLLALLHKGETITEPLDINKCVFFAIDFVKANSQPSSYKFEFNFAEGLPPVSANAIQVQKVLVNLLNNAIESMKESGKNKGAIMITTCRSPNVPNFVQVTICDSGMGVPDNDSLNKLFQPFYTTKNNGLGMGLAISRALIEAHGGKMWAEKNSDCGISVHFTLSFVL